MQTSSQATLLPTGGTRSTVPWHDVATRNRCGAMKAGERPHYSDMPLSRLGLGTWAFGRTGWGVQDDRDSRAAILRAVERDITWIDTAAVYGDGHSERVVGDALQQLPAADRPLVFTKGGIAVADSTGATFRDLSSSFLRQQCDESLQRLRIERIDLYQLHWPVQDLGVVEDAWETLDELRRLGKIRYAGVSNFDVSLLERCATRHAVGFAQLPLSLVSRESAQGALAWVAEHGARALVYSPLESGLLSGRFSRARLEALPDTDWRRRRQQFREPALTRNLALIERLEPVAADLGATLADMAIAWALSWPGVSGVIVGARNPEQVEGWSGASRLVLEPAALSAIAAALIATGAGAGPVDPASVRCS